MWSDMLPANPESLWGSSLKSFKSQPCNGDIQDLLSSRRSSWLVMRYRLRSFSLFVNPNLRVRCQIHLPMVNNEPWEPLMEGRSSTAMAVRFLKDVGTHLTSWRVVLTLRLVGFCVRLNRLLVVTTRSKVFKSSSKENGYGTDWHPATWLTPKDVVIKLVETDEHSNADCLLFSQYHAAPRSFDSEATCEIWRGFVFELVREVPYLWTFHGTVECWY